MYTICTMRVVHTSSLSTRTVTLDTDSLSACLNVTIQAHVKLPLVKSGEASHCAVLLSA